MKQRENFFLLSTSLHGTQKGLAERLGHLARRGRRRWYALAGVLILSAALAACAFGGSSPEPQPGADSPVRPELDKSISPELDMACAEAIMDYHYREQSPEVFRAEAHDVLGAEVADDQTTVYLLSLYQEYIFVDQAVATSGSSMPLAITFQYREYKYDGDGQVTGVGQEEGQLNYAYDVLEIWQPEDGENYGHSIRDKFPAELTEQAIFMEGNEARQARVEEQAAVWAAEQAAGVPPLPELTEEQQAALDALRTEFTPDTARAWLEAMLPWFSLAYSGDERFIPSLTLDWQEDSAKQGWVLATVEQYGYDHYFYVLADGGLRAMGDLERVLSLDTSAAPERLVMVDSGDLMEINGTRSFPGLITAQWDVSGQGAGGWAGIRDPLSGGCALFSWADCWLPVGQGEEYGQNKSATLMELISGEQGLTLVYAQKEGDSIYAGGPGLPWMQLLPGGSGGWQLPIPQARLDADFALVSDGDGPVSNISVRQEGERGIVITFDLSDEAQYYHFSFEDMETGQERLNMTMDEMRTLGYVRFKAE